MGGYGEYSRVRSGLADKYRIRLNILLAGKIGVKGLVIEYGGYSGEYSPTPSLKLLARLSVRNPGKFGFLVSPGMNDTPSLDVLRDYPSSLELVSSNYGSIGIGGRS